MSSVLMKCNLTEEESERIFKEFDGYLSREEEETLSRKFTQYCFYETWGRKNYRECSCTNCGMFDVYKDENPGFFAEHHKDEVRCPSCGETVTLYSLGRMRTGAGLKEWQRAAFVRKASDGGVLLSSGYATKEYSPHNLRPETTWYEKSRTYLAPGKRGQWQKELCNYWNQFYYCATEGSDWKKSASVEEPFKPAMMQHDGSYWFIGADNLLDTSLQYCQMEDWYREICGTWLCEEAEPVRQVYKYLARYTAFPQMEMAVKVGMYRAVEELVMDGRKNHRYLNWNAKTVQGFLRMNKQDAKAFLRAEGDIAQLINCKDTLKTGVVRSVQEYLGIVEEMRGMQGVVTAAACAAKAGVDIKKAVKYVKKQAGEISVSQALSYWKDYLDMAAQLEYDMSEETVVMPKDLKERHDAAATMIKVRASAEAKKKYQKRYKELCKKYEFRLGDLCVVVPQSGEDIVAEGKTLHHCVGGYAARHLGGTLDILFIRHARKPNRSFLTVELAPPSTGRGRPTLRQIHGYKNENYASAPEAPRNKYAWFLDAWLDWVKAGSKRDNKGQPVLPAGKEKTA